MPTITQKGSSGTFVRCKMPSSAEMRRLVNSWTLLVMSWEYSSIEEMMTHYVETKAWMMGAESPSPRTRWVVKTDSKTCRVWLLLEHLGPLGVLDEDRSLSLSETPP